MTEEEKNRVREKIALEKHKVLSNEAPDILRSWTALEVLTPQAYRPPEKDLIASLKNTTLPWEGQGERSRPNHRLYYEIALGTIELGKAVAALLDLYADKRLERPLAKGMSLLATVIVDHAGKLVGDNPIAISSFGWGVPKALKGDLSALSEWTNAESDLIRGLDKILRRLDKDGNQLPLDRFVLNTGYTYIVDTLGLPHDWVNSPSFALRIHEYFKNQDPPTPSLLNSFFLNDLSTVKNMFQEGKATKNLRSYLGLDKPAQRIDLLNDQSALEVAIAPDIIPPARWPGPGRHSLVLLQQAAVNLAISALKETGILAVNGPPGTGKTTLLRDILASIVTQRAEVLCSFNNPADAFEKTGQKIQFGQAWLDFYKLSEKLKGYEVLIASSNNKAVENVSAELPGIQAISDDATDLRYFTPLATDLMKKESWGLIAAVLGNAANRGKFRQTFWWDNDVGLSTYLTEASGTPQIIEIKDQETGKVLEARRPRIVVECDAPENHAQAMRRWQDAQKEFQSALSKSKKSLAQLAQTRKTLVELSAFATQEQSAFSDVQNAQDHQTSIQRIFDASEKSCLEAEEELQKEQETRNRHYAMKPGFFARFLQRARYNVWKHDWNRLCKSEKLCRTKREKSFAALSRAKTQLQKAASQVREKSIHYNVAVKAHAEARHLVEAAKAELSEHLISEDFFVKNHRDKHTFTPWCNQFTQRLRDDVFIAAIKLHKAFIDASARPLRHNLSLLMNVFSGRTFPDIEKQALMSDLWSSFFLVVPSVSTTFASVERMLGKLPPESLGWLLVDEAGQALPQAAVGAIMRTKRAVVVGDPIQIEPVVTLPDTLTQNICRHFGVNPDSYNAPEASMQTIADAATPYYAEFDGKYGRRSVGVPLLVHRRCADPMFSVSNAIAYERLMVQAKRPGLSKIRDCLGPSSWIDVQGQAEEKWSPQEGYTVLELLKKLKQNNTNPDLYIVTPFVIVQDNMRLIIRESGILEGWVADPYHWSYERVGTVHTVQGREAEAVILILGAPSPTQGGARGWAGGRPNLLNVALTRAKEVAYVVGNRSLWQTAGLFKELADRLYTQSN